MRKSTAAAALILGLSFAADAWAQGEGLGVRARRWRSRIDGDFQADNSLLAGTNFDLRATADMDEEIDINDFGASFAFPGLGKVNLQFWEGSFWGETTLGQDVVLDGTTFTGGTPVDTTLDCKVGSILFEYSSRPPAMFAGNAFAFQTGLKSINIKGEFESALDRQESAVKGYLPALGMHGRITVGQYLSVEVEANALFAEAFEMSGLSGTFYDAAVSGQFTMSGFYAGLGYRWFRIEAEDERGGDKTQVDASIQGAFLEIGYKM